VFAYFVEETKKKKFWGFSWRCIKVFSYVPSL